MEPRGIPHQRGCIGAHRATVPANSAGTPHGLHALLHAWHTQRQPCPICVPSPSSFPSPSLCPRVPIRAQCRSVLPRGFRPPPLPPRPPPLVNPFCPRWDQGHEEPHGASRGNAGQGRQRPTAPRPPPRSGPGHPQAMGWGLRKEPPYGTPRQSSAPQPGLSPAGPPLPGPARGGEAKEEEEEEEPRSRRAAVGAGAGRGVIHTPPHHRGGGDGAAVGPSRRKGKQNLPRPLTRGTPPPNLGLSVGPRAALLAPARRSLLRHRAPHRAHPTLRVPHRAPCATQLPHFSRGPLQLRAGDTKPDAGIQRTTSGGTDEKRCGGPAGGAHRAGLRPRCPRAGGTHRCAPTGRAEPGDLGFPAVGLRVRPDPVHHLGSSGAFALTAPLAHSSIGTLSPTLAHSAPNMHRGHFGDAG